MRNYGLIHPGSSSQSEREPRLISPPGSPESVVFFLAMLCLESTHPTSSSRNPARSACGPASMPVSRRLGAPTPSSAAHQPTTPFGPKKRCMSHMSHLDRGPVFHLDAFV